MPSFTASNSGAEERRQGEVAAQIQRMLDASPELQAQVGKTWDPHRGGCAGGQGSEPPWGEPAMTKGHPDKKNKANSRDEAELWRVVGGQSTGGLVVRTGKGTGSPRKDERLSFDAQVRELDLQGERLHYQLVLGSGPSFGWVSTKLKGAELLVREEVGEKADFGDRTDEAESATPVRTNCLTHEEAPGSEGLGEVLPSLEDLMEEGNENRVGTMEKERGQGACSEQDGTGTAAEDRWRGGTAEQEAPGANAVGQDLSKCSLEEALALLDRDEEQEEAESQEGFFALGSASRELALWSDSSRQPGLVTGRGREFSFNALRAQGQAAVQALAGSEAAESHRPAASETAVQVPPPEGQQHDLRGRLQSTSSHSRALPLRSGAMRTRTRLGQR